MHACTQVSSIVTSTHLWMLVEREYCSKQQQQMMQSIRPIQYVNCTHNETTIKQRTTAFHFSRCVVGRVVIFYGEFDLSLSSRQHRLQYDKYRTAATGLCVCTTACHYATVRICSSRILHCLGTKAGKRPNECIVRAACVELQACAVF